MLGLGASLDSRAACAAYMDHLPADQVRLARINGHLAQTKPSSVHGWSVDLVDARHWCRDGINRLRVDLWPR
jgi:hypothetical protein